METFDTDRKREESHPETEQVPGEVGRVVLSYAGTETLEQVQEAGRVQQEHTTDAQRANMPA